VSHSGVTPYYFSVLVPVGTRSGGSPWVTPYYFSVLVPVGTWSGESLWGYTILLQCTHASGDMVR